MKDPRGDKARLLHILDAIVEIEDYTKGFDFQQFFHQSMARFASIKQLEIIGEAANHLSGELIDLYPQVEWREIIALRNILIHEYFGVDAKIVWDIICENLPSLKKAVGLILKDYE